MHRNSLFPCAILLLCAILPPHAILAHKRHALGMVYAHPYNLPLSGYDDPDVPSWMRYHRNNWWQLPWSTALYTQIESELKLIARQGYKSLLLFTMSWHNVETIKDHVSWFNDVAVRNGLSCTWIISGNTATGQELINEINIMKHCVGLSGTLQVSSFGCFNSVTQKAEIINYLSQLPSEVKAKFAFHSDAGLYQGGYTWLKSLGYPVIIEGYDPSPMGDIRPFANEGQYMAVGADENWGLTYTQKLQATKDRVTACGKQRIVYLWCFTDNPEPVEVGINQKFSLYKDGTLPPASKFVVSG